MKGSLASKTFFNLHKKQSTANKKVVDADSNVPLNESAKNVCFKMHFIKNRLICH